MKKFFIYLGVVFAVLTGIGIIGSILDPTETNPVKEIETELSKCSDTVEMQAMFNKLDTIKEKGGPYAQHADSVLKIKEFIAFNVKLRFMDIYVKEAKKNIEKQFDQLDGSHIALTKIIKAQLNDPESFKHVETRYEIGMGYKYINVHETFRFKNIYGGVETHMMAAKYTQDGEFIDFISL